MNVGAEYVLCRPTIKVKLTVYVDNILKEVKKLINRRP